MCADKTSTRWSDKQIDGFHKAAQSLKLYRRAELQDERGAPLIEALYVDPLPNNHVLQTILKPNTTFLIGRKGTGKSTIFQRAQHELRKHPKYVSVYIDIKTIFESSQTDSTLLDRIANSSQTIMPKESLEKLLLHRAFLRAVISEMRNELEKKIKVSIWEKLKRKMTGSLDDLFEGLDELLDESDSDRFISVLGIKQTEVTSNREASGKTSLKTDLGVELGPTPSLKGEFTNEDNTEISSGQKQEFADILMRVFNIKELLLQLKDLLNRISVKHLYIFVDDFSELPESAMQIVVDALLAPLNNWSEELIKFKIAAYPNRIYFGQIDKTKIDEINLDIFSLYGKRGEFSRMEEKAIDFTRRVIENRLAHFCACETDTFFDAEDDVWRPLFYATMANPRNLGQILFYLYETDILYHKTIGRKAIRDAARRYYEEKIQPYFTMNKYLHESFGERSSILGLKELLESIVKRARDLKSYQRSKTTSSIKGVLPTSHFHVLESVEPLLTTLELNFFLTKYYELQDRDGRKVSVFALNFGLCQSYSIEFGRPPGTEFRHYFIDRKFDYTPILTDYLNKNQEIECDSCHEKYEFANLESLRMYEMRCPKCMVGLCKITNLSRKYEAVLKTIQSEALLPQTELGILQILQLQTKPNSLRAKEIAQELDCSYQLVGKRGKILNERGLVEKLSDENHHTKFRITPTAKERYFGKDETTKLDIED